MKINKEVLKQWLIKITNTNSWQVILAGSILVWILGCNKNFSGFIAEQKNTLAVLLALFYIVLLGHAIYTKKDTSVILGLVLLGGFLLKAYYVLAAPYNITKHDIGYFLGFDTGEAGDGHFGYIEYLYKNHHMPDFDPRTRWSFYNPPGFYIASAIILGITKLFPVDITLCYESMQALTLFFSSLSVWTCCQILKEFKISGKWLILLTALLSFHPFYMIMSVTLTNDCMTMYFMVLAIWYTIRWHKSPELKNIIIIAFATGLAMFTKLNAAIISFGIGAVFIYIFWVNRQKWKNFVIQFIIFLIICAPVGLYNPVRNYIKFDIPLTYIQELTTDNPLYIPASDIPSRLYIPSYQQISYAFMSYDTTTERNIWIQALRTALFDELIPDTGSSLFGATALILLWISILLVILMNIAFISSFSKHSLIKPEMQLFFAIEYITMLFFYAKFCLDEPYICTMNFRYIPASIIFPLAGTAIWIKKQYETGNNSKIQYKIFTNLLFYGIICFSIISFITNLDLISWSSTLL